MHQLLENFKERWRVIWIVEATRGARTPLIQVSHKHMEITMNTLKLKLDTLKNQSSLATLVTILTCLVVVFSTYMSASFWVQLGTTKTACITFTLLGVFLELSKICAGITVVSVHGVQSHILKTTAIAVLAIFTLTSFIASVGTIAHELKAGKTTAFNSNSEVKFLQNAIAAQEQIISSLLQSQQADTVHGYRARANATLTQIKQTQIDLEKLQNKLNNTKISDATVSTVVVIFSSLIPLEQDQWERVLTVILGALTEICSLFLLYLNFSLRKAAASVGKDKYLVATTEKDVREEALPISSEVYDKITKQIIEGKLEPRQRDLKKVVNLGNEKIAKIFSKWVDDRILIREGRGYRRCVATS